MFVLTKLFKCCAGELLRVASLQEDSARLQLVAGSSKVEPIIAR